MTREDFNSHVRDYRRLEWLRGVLFLALLVGVAVATLLAGRRIDRVGFDGPAIAGLAVAYVGVAILMYYVLVRLGRKQLWQGVCLGCGRFLLGKHADVVRHTGRCPRCGSQILQ